MPVVVCIFDLRNYRINFIYLLFCRFATKDVNLIFVHVTSVTYSSIIQLSSAYRSMQIYLPSSAPRLRNALLNPLTPNDLYISRTAPLTSKRCILYIYSTNICTEYFKQALYSPFFFLQNAVCFIILICLVPILFTLYIQSVLKLKK